MDSRLINEYLDAIDCFIGTFPRDGIPVPDKLPKGYIINTHTSDLPGEHWVAIYIDSRGRGQYFDSYGLFPLYNEFTEFLNDYCTSWNYNSRTFQSSNSSTCGLYCIFFILFRCLGFSYCQFASFFNQSENANDFILTPFLDQN